MNRIPATVAIIAACFLACASPAIAQPKNLVCEVGGMDMQITFDEQRDTMSADLNGRHYDLKYVRITPSGLMGSASFFTISINRYTGAVSYLPMRETSQGRESNGRPPPAGSCQPGELKQKF